MISSTLRSNSKTLSKGVIYLFLTALPLISVARSPQLFNNSLYEKNYRRFTQDSPDEIYVGNSVLGSRIDSHQYISKAAEENLAVDIYQLDGTGTSAWYLFTKNIASKSNADRVFLLVVENEYTCPDYRLGSEQSALSIFESTPNISSERRFHSVINSGRPYLEKVKTGLDLSPVNSVQSFLDSALKDFSLSLLDIDSGSIDYGNDELHQDLSFVLAQENSSVFNVEKEDCSYSFHDNLQNSFLPDMVKIFKDIDTDLVFLRVKTKPDLETTTAHVVIDQYFHDFSQYVEREGSKFIDLTQSEPFDSSYYRDAIHMNNISESTEWYFKAISDIPSQQEI